MTDNNDLFQFDDFSGVDTPEMASDSSDVSASDSSSEPMEVEAERIVPDQPQAGNYDDNAIQHLEWNEHIRRRPGMY
ncbi:MAG: hypothetical protein K2G69_06695, partial [Muribaculaceae bacterium]|nr:hypothetical protein [Muribaculaceae bacterium]